MLYLSLMRHGQTTHTHALRGALDDELTDVGFGEMQAGWQAFAHKKDIEMIYSSPLKRCAKFATQLSDELGLPLRLNPDLKEMNFGDWEGQSVADIHQKYPDELSAFWQTPTQYTPPNAESLLAFAKRVDNAIADIKDIAKAHHLRHILVITHGGVIKYLLTKINQMPLDDLLKNGAEHGRIYTFDGDKLP